MEPVDVHNYFCFWVAGADHACSLSVQTFYMHADVGVTSVILPIGSSSLSCGLLDVRTGQPPCGAQGEHHIHASKGLVSGSLDQMQRTGT
jgi:hypothetical protein